MGVVTICSSACVQHPSGSQHGHGKAYIASVQGMSGMASGREITANSWMEEMHDDVSLPWE